jgi:hypothetical protein
MRSQLLMDEASRRRADEQFKTPKKVSSAVKANSPRQTEVEKITRLRALRLAKEAVDKDTANREAADAAAAKALRSGTRRRVPSRHASSPSESK